MRASLVLASAMIISSVGCSKSDDKNATDEVGTTSLTFAPVVVPPGDSDQQIIRRVESSFAADPFVSRAARNVEVSVYDGIVTLTGPVDNIPTKWTLEGMAKRVNGGDEVLDKTTIAPSANTLESADDQISYAIQRSLAFDPAIAHDGESITIDVVKGIVTLRGSARDGATKEAVERLVEQTPGVIDVNNQLAVR